MATILQKLAPNLEKELKKADEIWVAVALMTRKGLNCILENISKTCRQNYIIGIDLPTDPQALKILHELSMIQDHVVGLFSQKKCYHPKVYLIRQGNRYIAFIGSANCTIGGLYNNIEISIQIDEHKICIELLKWFEDMQQISKSLSGSFLTKYSVEYQARKKKKQEDERTARKEKDAINREDAVTLSGRQKFLNVLRKYRAGNNYQSKKQDRDNFVKKLRNCLDYPSFRSNNIDVDEFFQIEELGHIIAIPKPTIKRKIRSFSRLLKMICDENIDIATRYNSALQGKLKIRGVSEGLISKVLTIHDPKKYYVKNKKSDSALKKYGIQIPRGINEGERYKITSKFLTKICEETKIDDLAVLDYYLYLEGLNNR